MSFRRRTSSGYRGTATTKAPVSRQSGGTSGDLTIDDYVPETPVVAYDPAAPMTAIQQQIRGTSPARVKATQRKQRARRQKQTKQAQARSYLERSENRRERQRKASEKRVAATERAVKAKTDKKAAPRPKPLPTQRSTDPAVAKISSTSRPKASPKLKAPAPVRSDPATAVMSTTPGRGPRVTRQRKQTARQKVRQARKAVNQSRVPAPLPLETPEQRKNARVYLNTGKQMGATKKELLAAAETGLVESGFKNYTDQAETDADSLGVRQERTSIYGTGPDGPTNVKASARRFYEESIGDTGGSRGAGMTAGQLAQTIQGSAHPERYDERKAEAVALLNAFEKGRPDPKAVKRLQKAKRQAVKVGALPPGSAKPARKEPAMWGGKKRGKIEFESWLTETDKEIANPAARLGRAISGQIGKPIRIISGNRPGSTTNSGNPSDHIGGNALDIHALDQNEAGGSVQTEKEGDAIATAAARVAGADVKSAEFKSFLEGGGVYEVQSPSGYRVQILWKTDVGGNHHNHVHVGLRAEPGAQPGVGGASSVGSGGGSTSFVSGGQVSSYAQATGQSVKQVGKKIVNGKLGPLDIYKKLESLGIESGKPAGVGESSTATSQPETSATLDALMKKYDVSA